MTTGYLATSAHGHGGSEVVFAPCRADHPAAVALLDAFVREQIDRYGFTDPPDLDPDDYDEPNGLFIVIYRQGVPVGCGGCRNFDQRNGTYEIKKTYLIPEARGLGLGNRLLDTLERAAAASGARRTILETGVRNAAALRLFASRGYTPMEGYVAGRNPAINRAFEKVLVEGAGSSHR